MTRALVALALATQIPFREWADETDDRVIETAWELIEEREGGSRKRPVTQGRVMGG